MKNSLIYSNICLLLLVLLPVVNAATADKHAKKAASSCQPMSKSAALLASITKNAAHAVDAKK